MKPLVLIAEDEPHIVESLSFLLERAGLGVATAQDGQSALAAIRNLAPAAMILDIMLHKENGLEVLKTVRSEPGLKNLRVLVLTAKGQENDRQTAMTLGADAFVTKPFSNRDLIDQIRALVGLSPDRPVGAATASHKTDGPRGGA